MSVNDSKNIVVAFGHNDQQFFIAAGNGLSQSQVPPSMRHKLSAELRTPITFASLGPGQPGNERYFLLGYTPANAEIKRARWDVVDAHLNTALLAAVNTKHTADFPSGVSFGANGAFSWWSDNECHYSHLGEDRLSWIKNMKVQYPDKRIAKLFLGANRSMVLVWHDQTFHAHDVSHKLALVISDARKKGLYLHHIAMSLSKPEWFFIQLSDASVTWHATKLLSEYLEDFAKELGVERYVFTSTTD